MNNIRKIFDISKDGGPSNFGLYLQKISEKWNLGLQVEVAEKYTSSLQAQADALLLSPELSEQVLPGVSLVSSQVRSLWALDSFFKDEAGWMCRVLEFEALRDILVSRAKEMDILKPAFIIGDGAKVRISAAVLADLGFAEIYLVSEDETALNENAAQISKSYIGLHFHPLLAQELTMQALNASVLINTVDLSANAPLLNDLSYFNFMERGGLVFDYNLENYGNHSLLDEAERAELVLLHCPDFAASLAMLWLRQLQISEEVLAGISAENLKQEWLALLGDSSKNPPSV